MSDDRFAPENAYETPARVSQGELERRLAGVAPGKSMPRKLVAESRRYLDLIPPPLPPERRVSADEIDEFIKRFEEKFK